MILLASIITVLQYYLAFFYFKLPGIQLIQYLGWVVWLLSLYLGFAPIFILRARGSIPQGKPYTETTRLVDSNLYAIIRHPQYTAGIVFNFAMCLLAQHWLVWLLGGASILLLYLDIQEADQEGIRKFGSAYQEYMQRVPQINLVAGLYRYLKNENIL